MSERAACASPSRPCRSGDVVAGKYVLLNRLGAGGMGVVFEAERGRDPIVAIKLLHPDRIFDLDSARRFRDEAIAARYVSHPNVVRVIDFSDVEAVAPYIVMEHIRGVSLGTILRRGVALPLLRAAELARQILAGVEAAHVMGVVHADIKSDNILVETSSSGEDAAKIIDLGLGVCDALTTRSQRSNMTFAVGW